MRLIESGDESSQNQNVSISTAQEAVICDIYGCATTGKAAPLRWAYGTPVASAS